MELMFNISEIYQRFNYEWADPRTNELILISSPFTLLAIIALYLWFCLKAGPKFMKEREAFKLRNILIIYNLFQVIISVHFFIVTSKLWLYKYNFQCEPVDYSYSPHALYVSSLVHMYFLSKITELLDTVFFVLRKKNSQASILHLYHHSSMVLITWLGTKYIAGGQTTLVGWINSFVHIIMYSYYFVSSLGPKYQKYLTWKKQLTILQLIKFIFGVVYVINALPTECAYPKPVVWLSLFQLPVFLYMFLAFYFEAYPKSKKIKEVNENARSGCGNISGKKTS